MLFQEVLSVAQWTGCNYGEKCLSLYNMISQREKFIYYTPAFAVRTCLDILTYLAHALSLQDTILGYESREG
jgi:hypothetical protein